MLKKRFYTEGVLRKKKYHFQEKERAAPHDAAPFVHHLITLNQSFLLKI